MSRHRLQSLLVALACGLGLAASPPGPAKAQAALAHSALGWELPAIDAVVAGRMARLCTARDQGTTGLDEESVAILLEHPTRLADGLASALQHGAWRVPAERGQPPTVWRVQKDREALLRELAARLPVELIVGRSRLALAPAITCEQRRAELILLGEVARAKHVGLLVDLAGACKSIRARADFERALTATLTRDSSACREVEGCWKQLPKDLHVSVLRALAESGQADALPVLAARFDAHPELTLALLSLTGTLAARTEAEPDARVTFAVRSRLDSERGDVRREAALAAGRLEDSASAGVLVEMLASSERSEREAAHWALRRISLLGLPADPRPWQLWLSSEQQWWANEWPACRDSLSAIEPARVVAALDSLARHRLRRSELAAAVAASGTLGASEFDEHRCHVLKALQSRAGLPFLRERLAASDPAVRAAAEAAWLATGRPLPSPSPGWAGAPR